MKSIILCFILILINFVSFGNTGKIDGKILDEKGEALTGVTVMIEGTTMGGRTDIDGKFVIRNVADGKYNLTVSYIGYEKKLISDVLVKGGTVEYLTITLNRSNKGLKEVVVKTQMKKETINALMVQQKNLATISDGISGEMIKKTPDRNTGDVLKRISGVSISENKFAVIRGLADRYNLAMLNGDILPSSEADRKAFSFDIFPSSLLENIIIIKAATPDRPGEFAGGIIDLKTKDAPTENFLSLQLGSGMNTISTFKPYYDSKNSSTDWLGYDKSMRVIPNSFPDRTRMNQSLSEYTFAQRAEDSRKFENTWGTQEKKSMSPFRNLQLSGGWLKPINKKSSIGVIGAVSYSRNFKTEHTERKELGEPVTYNYFDTVHKDNVLIGTMLNVGVKLNNVHRITFKNSFTINAEDQTVRRNGYSDDNQQFIKGQALWYSNNQLLSNQLSSEHILTKHKIKLQVGVGRNHIVRTIPDLRRSWYTLNYDDVGGAYRAVINNAANPFYNGRFFAKTNEAIYSGNADLSIPYKLFKTNHMLKAGVYLQNKDRTYDARVLGYVVNDNAPAPLELQTLPVESIFATENIKDKKGFLLGDATQVKDSYTASSDLKAYYIMNDNMVAEKVRLVYGVRIENFKQNLITGETYQGDLEVKKQQTDILPSMNLTYLLNKKTNIRACASKTLSRPEFRELSPSSFYNFNLSATFTGERNLEQTSIQNYDLRYEYFMGKGEMVSGSVFYKKFENAIELTVPRGTAPSQKVYSFLNAPLAKSFGLELEFRKTLAFLNSNETSQFNNVTLFGNFAYIKSSVNITTTSSVEGETTYKRPMQGQSPYLINAGVTYTYPKFDFATTLVFNRIGERIFAVGNGIASGDITDLYEAPRNVIDFSISKKINKKFEVKFTISDLLSNPVLYYYNYNNTTKKIATDDTRYNKNEDFVAIRTKQGSNIGLSIAYLFSK